MSKKLINGLKYEKLTEEQLYDLSQWELVDIILAYREELQAKEQECERLKKWLPIVTRLEEQFKSHEKAKGIDYKTYAEQVFTELDQLKSENKHLNDLLNQALKELEKTREILTEIKEIASREAETSRYNGSSTWKQILQKISECEVEE